MLLKLTVVHNEFAVTIESHQMNKLKLPGQQAPGWVDADSYVITYEGDYIPFDRSIFVELFVLEHSALADGDGVSSTPISCGVVEFHNDNYNESKKLYCTDGPLDWDVINMVNPAFDRECWHYQQHRHLGNYDVQFRFMKDGEVHLGSFDWSVMSGVNNIPCAHTPPNPQNPPIDAGPFNPPGYGG